MFVADLNGKREGRCVFPYPLAGLAKALGDLVGVQQVVGVGRGSLVLECKDAGVEGALHGGGKRQKGHNVRSFIAGDFGQ